MLPCLSICWLCHMGMTISIFRKGFNLLVYQIIRIITLSALTLLLSACQLTTPVMTDSFVDNDDGTVTDVKTNLTWQRCSVGQHWTGETFIGEPILFAIFRIIINHDYRAKCSEPVHATTLVVFSKILMFRDKDL